MGNSNDSSAMTVKDQTSKSVALLNKVYEMVLDGIPMVSEPLEDLVNPYLKGGISKDDAIEKFIRYQKYKCATTGFVTGIGGILTLPAISADLLNSLYIEIRMIAGIAMMRGYDIKDDRVRTAAYMCLVGNAIGDIIKQTGIRIIEKVTMKKLLPKLTRATLTKINQKVGFRFITKGGSKGVINLGKGLPVIGGIVGGTWNWFEVKGCAKIAKQMFDENNENI